MCSNLNRFLLFIGKLRAQCHCFGDENMFIDVGMFRIPLHDPIIKHIRHASDPSHKYSSYADMLSVLIGKHYFLSALDDDLCTHRI